MKKILALLVGVAALACGVPAQAGNVSVSVASATTVSLAAAVPARSARIRAYSLVSAGTTTVQFVYGTQTTTPCDTGATALTGAMSMAANGSLSLGNGAYDLIVAPSGKQLCLTQTGAVQLSGFVTLSQN